MNLTLSIWRHLLMVVLLAGYFFKKGAKTPITKHAVKIRTEDGCEGAYVLQWGASSAVFGQMQMLAPMLVGRHAEHRQGIYDDLKREARQFDHMGHGHLWILRSGTGRARRLVVLSLTCWRLS